MKLKKYLPGLAAVLLIAGCTTGCTFLFLAAYDAGARSAAAAQSASSRPAARATAPAVSHAASSAPPSAALHAGTAEKHDRLLVLVGPDNPLPSWFVRDLTEAFGVQMDSSAAKAFAEMRTAASGDGISLWVSSAYRSSQLQSELFQREVEEYAKTCPTYEDAVTAAERSVARPGRSEHETGLALDLNGVQDDFDTTAAFRWLQNHAQNYGFILRYPKDKQNVTKIKYEPWHYRYVGTANAKAICKTGLCLEEYEALP